MKKIILIVAMLVAFTAQAQAQWIGNVTLREVTPLAGGLVLVSIIDPPSAYTCNHWGFEFKFDGTTPGGDKLYRTLMTARAMEKTVNINFSNSTAPGTNHNNGCTSDAMAVLWSVGF